MSDFGTRDEGPIEAAAPHLPERSAGVAIAADGMVILDGPDGVAVSMTPEAAEETGRRLIEAARRVMEATNAP